MEYWKRTQSELAYQWDVDQFEENEPDRPEFYGTKTKIVSRRSHIIMLVVVCHNGVYII